MNLSCLLPLINEVPACHQVVDSLRKLKGEYKITVLDAAKPYFIAAVYEAMASPMLVLTAQPEMSKKLYDQLQIWCSSLTPVQLFPEPSVLPYEYLASDFTTTLDRLRTLSILTFCQNLASNSNKPPLIVASAPAIANKTVAKADFVSACRILKSGVVADPLQLLAEWEAIGYEIESMVEVPGTMSRRGGIVDIFPPSSELPARLEFFGNRVETIRFFDPNSQRSLKLASSITIIPAKEILMSQAKEVLGKITNTLDLSGCSLEIQQRVKEDMGRLLERQWFHGAEFYSPLFNTGSLLDYLPNNSLIIVDNLDDIKVAIEKLDDQAEELRQAKIRNGEIASSFPRPYFGWTEFVAKIKEIGSRLILWSWDMGGNNSLPLTSAPNYGGKLDIFLKSLSPIVKEHHRIIVVSHQANRLSELLHEEDILASPMSCLGEIPPRGSITLIQGSLAEGWTMKGILSVLTDAELFGFVKQRRLAKKQPVRRQLFLSQLSPGDYAVHIEHGIGRFSGVIKMSSEGVEKEYLVLEYAAGDKLYIPTDQIDRISRYIGAGDQPPTLSRLGSQEWVRTKQRIKESAANTAQELLALYATREVVSGFTFSPDTIWQQELEASFPYVETPDQLETVHVVKEDMEKPKPMDRLVCGDVGYGKTEVALRAAFKAVMDNKQVALLVPTTVLAQQHFITFKERLQAFPVRVEVLSRFCTEREQQDILEGLANGTVDICIGTHRLLQKDVMFKNLGLIIIDEEQRFGVVHKERLKQMRREVDVLTLSATPIPRTLHMALAGIRDMSVMEIPPEERLPIKTFVGTYDDRLCREAILRELERNGQVFFVHNRIQSIAAVANKLESLVPEARIAVAHGRMPEEELEKVMFDFTEGKSDVLVSTTIIESGLDIPNVNTLIVNQADKLGLTQLYQLRGRVGRGNNRAYAYFVYDKGKQLTSQAQKRLRTIYEATELGAGFGIAMKDLEIRGAGNLLGMEQSGYIAAVGFDLYCRLLAEAVDELKAKQEGRAEEKKPRLATPTIALPLDAYIPEEYVPDLNIRLTLYQRLAKMEEVAEISSIAQELTDRFGGLPSPVKNLLYVVEIRVLAAKADVESISFEGKQIVLRSVQGVKMKELPLGEDFKGGVNIGVKQIRLDIRRFGGRWTEVLKKIIQEMATV